MMPVICTLPDFRPTFSRSFTTNVLLTGIFMHIGSHHPNDLQECWSRVLQHSDTQALQAMHAELYPAMHHYASKLLKDDSSADDAIQEVFVKMWQQRYSIGSIQHVKGYVFTLLRRHILNVLRSQKTRLFHIGKWGNDAVILEFSPEEVLMHQDSDRERQHAVSRALNQLPARQREVLYFRFYESLDYKEIAGIMGINYQSVVNLSFKAMQQLKQWFAATNPGGSKKI